MSQRSRSGMHFVTLTIFLILLSSQLWQAEGGATFKLKKFLKKALLLKALVGKKGVTIIPIPIPLNLFDKEKEKEMDMPKMMEMHKMMMMDMPKMMEMPRMMEESMHMPIQFPHMGNPAALKMQGPYIMPLMNNGMPMPLPLMNNYMPMPVNHHVIIPMAANNAMKIHHRNPIMMQENDHGMMEED